MRSFKETIRKNLPLILLLAVAALLFSLQLNSLRAFHQDDEYLYIRIAEEMFRGRELWIPTWFGETAFYKPPLTYWIISLSFLLLGVKLEAARLGVVLCALATVYFTYLLGKELFNARTGITGGLLLATCFGSLSYSRAGMPDFPLVLCLTAALYYFYLGWRDNSPQSSGMFFLVAGASTLAKGPVSLVILGLFAASFLLCFRGWQRVFTVKAIWGLGLGGILVLLWPGMIWVKGLGPQWFKFFILQENLGKFTAPLIYHFYDWLPYYLQHFFPWSLLMLCSLVLLFKTRNFRHPEYAALLLFFASVTVVYLLPAVKLQHYVLPGLPALAVMLGAVWHQNKTDAVMKTGTWMTGAIFTLILIIILALLKVSGSFGVVALLLGAGLSVGLALIFILRRNLDSSIYSFAVMALLLIQAAPSFTFDPISREAIKYIKERQNQVAVVKTQVYQLSYLLDRKVVQVVNSDELQNIAIAGGFIITSRTNRDALMPEGVSSSPGLREICQWEKWKESVTADQVLQALLTGNTSDLVEPVYLLSGLKP